MPWLFLLIAAALFLVALGSSSVVMVILCLLVSLGLSIVAIMSLLAQRVDNSARSETMLIDPQELRRLREQAEARKSQGSDAIVPAVAALAIASADTSPPHPAAAGYHGNEGASASFDGHSGDSSGGDG